MDFKYDKARKELVYNGKRYKGNTLEYFVQKNTFDKNISKFINYKGLTFVIKNPAEQDEEIFFPVEFKYQNTPEQKRLFAMKSAQELEQIADIKFDYNG